MLRRSVCTEKVIDEAMNIMCLLGAHFWWLKAMTPMEIEQCVNAGAPWPPLTEICLRCKKERRA